jgi:SAM-dependent methyltransferase
VIVHQVLHYAQQPAAAVAEAARLLAPGGRLLIADFAPARARGASHPRRPCRLGFADDAVLKYLEAAGSTARVVEHLEGGELTVTIWAGERPPRQTEGSCMSTLAPGIASWRKPLFEDVAGDIEVSFEFFPAQDGEDGSDAVGERQDA